VRELRWLRAAGQRHLDGQPGRGYASFPRGDSPALDRVGGVELGAARDRVNRHDFQLQASVDSASITAPSSTLVRATVDQTLYNTGYRIHIVDDSGQSADIEMQQAGKAAITILAAMAAMEGGQAVINWLVGDALKPAPPPGTEPTAEDGVAHGPSPHPSYPTSRSWPRPSRKTSRSTKASPTTSQTNASFSTGAPD
jgi:hypothetical protein